MHHECSVAAVCRINANHEGSNTTLKTTVRMLLDMQTRGQLAAGISSYNPGRPEILKTYKAVGSVDRVFEISQPQKFQQTLRAFDGMMTIGHTRYATTGRDDLRYAQPFERRHGQLWKWFSFAFNGTVSNHMTLRDELAKSRGFHFILDSDTEVIEHFIAFHLRGDHRPDLVSVMKNLSKHFDGAYCIVFLDASGRMMIARDPLGLRPLNWAEQDGLVGAASESSALMNAGFRNVHPVKPGEVIIIENGSIKKTIYADLKSRARCFFEWIYFANVASTIDDSGVYESRAAAGRILAQEEHITVCSNSIAVPVPDTAKAAADAFAYTLGIPCVEGIFRNRFIGRTFIQSDSTRADAASAKYTPLPSVLRGKRVFLVEDSIVRSTTLKTLIKIIRTRCQPLELHVRVACPPIVAPCYYGIDLSTVAELFAAQFDDPNSSHDQAKMAQTLDVDSLRYLQIEDVAKSIATESNTLCTGCVTGFYPTETGNKL